MSRLGTSSFRFFVALVATLALTAASAHAQLTNVDDATDVCPPTADPCIITQEVGIADGAVLDFGLRALEVRLAGVLDSGAGTATVRCGSFTATTGAGTAISASGPSGEDTIEGGAFALEVLRACSGDPSVRCIEPADCELGTCDVDHCTGSPERACFVDEDCALGLCSVGSGDADLNGALDADGRTAGQLVVHTAGSLLLHQRAHASSTGTASGGGSIDLVSGHGSIALLGPIEAQGGGGAEGGLVSIDAAGNVSVGSTIDATGGDFDGGFVTIQGGGDVAIDGDVLVDASIGEGSGGDISIIAGNDLTIGATRTVSANGNKARQGPFSGDGGTLELEAAHDLFVFEGTTFSADGEEPNGSGNSIAFTAGHDLSLDGAISSRSRGNDGEGGEVALSAGATLTTSTALAIDVRGGSAGGGSVVADAGSSLDFRGSVLAQTTGEADRLVFSSRGQARISGDLGIAGATSTGDLDGTIEVSACGVRIAAGAELVNEGTHAKNTFAASGGITIEHLASVAAQGSQAQNVFVVGPDSPAPVVEGTISPAPQLVVDDQIAVCAECGNGQIDQGETCDDSNATPGDGCTDCQDDRCIAQTLNWPNAALCNDEATCTSDACNTVSGNCEHTVACSDGFACTTDDCGPSGECAHETDDSLCNDGKFCTKDVCVETSGCVAFDEDKPCDDGLGCTSDDACTFGRCRGTKDCADGNFCSNVTGQCVAGETTTTTTNSTTTSTTTTTTTLPPVCGDGDIEGAEECDDGSAAWDFGEPCNAECQLLACGDPDDDTHVRTTDSLIALRTAVGAEHCATCICDIDTSGQVTATDALALLRGAVGLPVTIACPACTL
jgi:cysteine-rich repeat protein